MNWFLVSRCAFTGVGGVLDDAGSRVAGAGAGAGACGVLVVL